jgi:hypothetical protein
VRRARKEAGVCQQVDQRKAGKTTSDLPEEFPARSTARGWIAGKSGEIHSLIRVDELVQIEDDARELSQCG